jgi:pyruvate dehydrogenase E2 component (dihydrolipoamide acetyltransferase)
VHYASVGTGEEVVVLVHGFGGDKNSWLFLQEPLAAGGPGRTVHALDLPGHGASGKDVGEGSLATLVDVVLGFLDAIEADAVHLAGHSLGGAVVAAAAERAPHRVRTLTLIAPAGMGPEADAEYLRGFAAATSRRELKPLLGRLFADESLVTRQLVDDVLRYKRLDGVDAALARLLDTLLVGGADRQAIDSASSLAGLEVPVLVVWGGADRILPAHQAPEPGGRVRVLVIPGAGHMVHMEAASDVHAAIEELINPT